MVILPRQSGQSLICAETRLCQNARDAMCDLGHEYDTKDLAARRPSPRRTTSMDYAAEFVLHATGASVAFSTLSTRALAA